MSSSLSLPPRLCSKLSHFRRRVWLVKLAEGLLAAIFGLGLSYLFVVGLDRLIDTPAWLRGLLLLAGAAVAGLGLPLKWHRWVWRQRRLEDAARLLRWKFPMLGDQLLGIVELAKEDSVTGRSERLVQAAMNQADDAVVDLDFSHAVPKASHWRWGLAAGAACALILAGFIAINEAAQNALVRWLNPWGDTQRYTFARVEPLPNPMVVPVAEPFSLPVSLSGESRWEPGGASGKIRGQDRVRARMADGGYAIAFPPQTGDANLFVKVGDVRETIRLEPRTRPELETLKVRLKLPDYLQYKTEPEIEVRGGAVSVVRGAQAEFEARVSRDLAHAQINGEPVGFVGSRFSSDPQEEPEERKITLTWEDELGLRPQEPLVMTVRPIEDEAPQIVARRDSLEQVVLITEAVIFDISAADDFGLRRVGLEWKGRGLGGDREVEPADGSKVASAGAPETTQLDARATFSAAREGVEPQTIEVRAWADDYMSGRERSYSSVFVLHVLSADDHAMWVTQQMARWLEAAKETYEREQRLHETNKEFRELSIAELDRPDTRRGIAAQASAETANGERLASLTSSGRKLVNHATKNDEFDAERLESWALMLRNLQDIAQNRMPNVADLLNQAADAEAGSPAALTSSDPGKAQPADPGGENSTGQGQESGKGSESQTAQNQSAKGEGMPGEPSESPSAPVLTAGPDSPKGSGAPKDGADPNSEKPPSDPTIALKESTMFKPDPASDEAQPPGKASPASLKLPTVSLAAPPKKFRQPAQECPAGNSLDQGIEEQRDLLAEFAKISDQLNEILASLESSTFVKRFKAASRQQTKLAGDLGVKALDGFGIARDDPAQSLRAQDPSLPGPDKKPEPEPAEEPDPDPDPDQLAVSEDSELPFVTTFAPIASDKAKLESDVVRVILTDLEGYFQRKADLHVKNVIGEMRDTDVVQELERVGIRAADNYSGNAIHAAELWADTMDRWAEEMVAVGKAFC